MVDCTTYSEWLGLLYTLRTNNFHDIVLYEEISKNIT